MSAVEVGAPEGAEYYQELFSRVMMRSMRSVRRW